MSDSNEQIAVGRYVVALHDLLGQGDEILKWSSYEDLMDKESEAFKAFRHTVNAICTVRTDFKGILEGLNQISPSDLPPEIMAQVDLFDHIKKAVQSKPRGEIQSQSFSDTNIWFTPTSDEHGNLYAASISRLLLGVCFAHLLALSRGTPCRGGIALACGTDAVGKILGTNTEIYGPALVEAYKLESNLADYHRVVIGDYLVKFLSGSIVDIDHLDNKSEQFAFHLYDNTMIQNALSLTCTDEDGCIILDFAGPKASRIAKQALIGAGIDPKKMFGNALGFAQKEANSFAQIRNHKLAGRYSALYRYLKDREGHWQ